MRRFLLGFLLSILFLSSGCDENKNNLADAVISGGGAPSSPPVASKEDVAKDAASSELSPPPAPAALPGPMGAIGVAGPMGSPGATGPTSFGPAEDGAAGSRGGEGSNGEALHSLLTAGSFDDALNLDIFSNYFGESSLAQGKINQLAQPDWQKLIPASTTQNHKKLDLSFVIDVTGSMGDELNYLKAEIDKISAEVSSSFPDVEQRYSLVVYRDNEDDFISKKYDFTSELASFQSSLNEHSASGGGDYPEAMHSALNDAIALQWGNSDTAKILFLVADAPPHDQYIQNTFDAIFALKDQGVTIYPVAASGVAELAESIMRTSALLTGGQYIFLTDDSGIGNEHAKPKFPCYYVEKLKDVMVRVIKDKLSNIRSEPSPEKLIRTVGKPVNGVCASEQ